MKVAVKERLTAQTDNQMVVGTHSAAAVFTFYFETEHSTRTEWGGEEHSVLSLHPQVSRARRLILVC